ncbi:hypothetical protein RIF29_25189 [Crotalaria pallida]|uniref:Uncharacterized protein n=1 Tax=Crotalaria pallida TaxID=3830 RepID=A0AAN9ENB8_CROPI
MIIYKLSMLIEVDLNAPKILDSLVEGKLDDDECVWVEEQAFKEQAKGDCFVELDHRVVLSHMMDAC